MMGMHIRLPDFGDTYNALKMRVLITRLEQLFARVVLDTTRGAYAVTGNLTLEAEDDTVLVDTSGGDVTITLPEISDDMIRSKREFGVVHTAASGTTTVAPLGADTICGAANALLTVQWTALRLRAITGGWVVV